MIKSIHSIKQKSTQNKSTNISDKVKHKGFLKNNSFSILANHSDFDSDLDLDTNPDSNLKPKSHSESIISSDINHNIDNVGNLDNVDIENIVEQLVILNNIFFEQYNQIKSYSDPKKIDGNILITTSNIESFNNIISITEPFKKIDVQHEKNEHKKNIIKYLNKIYNRTSTILKILLEDNQIVDLNKNIVDIELKQMDDNKVLSTQAVIEHYGKFIISIINSNYQILINNDNNKKTYSEKLGRLLDNINSLEITVFGQIYINDVNEFGTKYYQDYKNYLEQANKDFMSFYCKLKTDEIKSVLNSINRRNATFSLVNIKIPKLYSKVSNEIISRLITQTDFFTKLIIISNTNFDQVIFKPVRNKNYDRFNTNCYNDLLFNIRILKSKLDDSIRNRTIKNIGLNKRKKLNKKDKSVMIENNIYNDTNNLIHEKIYQLFLDYIFSITSNKFANLNRTFDDYNRGIIMYDKIYISTDSDMNKSIDCQQIPRECLINYCFDEYDIYNTFDEDIRYNCCDQNDIRFMEVDDHKFYELSLQNALSDDCKTINKLTVDLQCDTISTIISFADEKNYLENNFIKDYHNLVIKMIEDMTIFNNDQNKNTGISGNQVLIKKRFYNYNLTTQFKKTHLNNITTHFEFTINKQKKIKFRTYNLEKHLYLSDHQMKITTNRFHPIFGMWNTKSKSDINNTIHLPYKTFKISNQFQLLINNENEHENNLNVESNEEIQRYNKITELLFDKQYYNSYPDIIILQEFMRTNYIQVKNKISQLYPVDPDNYLFYHGQYDDQICNLGGYLTMITNQRYSIVKSELIVSIWKNSSNDYCEKKRNDGVYNVIYDNKTNTYFSILNIHLSKNYSISNLKFYLNSGLIQDDNYKKPRNFLRNIDLVNNEVVPIELMYIVGDFNASNNMISEMLKQIRLPHEMITPNFNFNNDNNSNFNGVDHGFVIYLN